MIVPPDVILTLLASAASAFLGVAAEKLPESGTGAIKHLAAGLGSIWSSLASSRVERAAERRELEPRRLRNHDLHQLVGRAVRLVLDELERELVNHGYLTGTLVLVRRGFSDNWGAIGADTVPEDVASVASTLAHGAAERPGTSRLSAAEWSTLLAQVSGIPIEEQKEFYRRAGDALHASYESALWEAAARAWKERDMAWPKLLLGAIGDITRSSGSNLQLSQEILEACKRIDAALSRYVETATRDLSGHLFRPWESTSAYPYHFSIRETPLLGSAAIAARDGVRGFLEDERSFVWWLWTGLEGAGKSRCATEACLLAEARPRPDGRRWQAGFVETGDLGRLKDSWRSVAISEPTLLVFDYVASAVDNVRAALTDLAARKDGTPVRALLLERHSDALSLREAGGPRPEWVDQIFWKDGDRRASEELSSMQYPAPGAPSLHFAPLDPAEVEHLALAVLSREMPGSTPAERAEVAGEVLRVPGSAARPLHVQIASTVLAERRESRPTSFAEVMRHYMRGRISYRRRQLTALYGNADEAEKVLNLMCVATLLRRVSLDEIDRLTSAHPAPSWRWRLPSPEVLARRGRLLGAFGQDPSSHVLSGLEPDLIGEWFVRLWCYDGGLDTTLDSATLTGIARELPGSSAGIQDFVQRTYRYFSDTTFWRALRNTLGRYSTPFGRAFDQRQALLLGGTTRRADTWYGAAIDRHITTVRRGPARRPAVVIDLMAGGSRRPESLLARHGRGLTLVAIDRDVSRLSTLPRGEMGKPQPGLRVVEREVDGRLDLRDILQESCCQETCDLVIAKKALHELPWHEQQGLIARIGEVVRPGGHVIVYADSPAFMDDAGWERWWEIEEMLKEALPIDLAAAADLTDRAHLFMPDALPFSVSSPSDAAVFANLWIHLKDWANYNRQEYERRYFSSVNELLDAFGAAGFETPEIGNEPRVTRVARFEMELRATRFIEEAINRLGYLAAEQSVTPEELGKVFRDNARYQLFCSVTAAHLWGEHGATPFGESAAVQAAPPEAFAVSDLLDFVRDESLGERLRQAGVPPLVSPSFRMPVHVMMLRKVEG